MSSDRLVIKKYKEDIDKLIEWKRRIEHNPSSPDIINTQCSYHFVAEDLRNKILCKEALSDIDLYASEAGLTFHYLN